MRRGFTLIEVMIAVAVMGMIGAVTYKAFDGAYDLKTRIERAEDRDQAVRGALNRIAREVSMAYLSEHYDHKRYRERPTFFKLKDGRGDAKLLFTSFAHERLHVDAKESDEAVFEYKLDRDPDSGTQSIFRRVKPQIDEEYERGGERAVLADNILKFTVEAWDAKSRDWRDEWDSNSATKAGQVLIPPRVKIAVTIKDEQGKEKVYSTQAKIFLGAPLDF
jgi:general secretion pathway protein J